MYSAFHFSGTGMGKLWKGRGSGRGWGLNRCIFVGAVALRIQQNERDTKGRFN